MGSANGRHAHMSYLFKPPEADLRAFDWRDLLRFGPRDDPFWRTVRTRQLGFMVRYMPLLLIVMTLNCAIVVTAFAQRLPASVFLLWLAAQVGLTLLWIGRFSVEKLVGVRTEPCPRLMRRLVFEQAVGGVAWAIVLAVLLPLATPEEAGYVLALGLATIATMAIPTAVFPLGTIAMVGPVFVGLLVGLILKDDGTRWSSEILLGGFVALVMRGNLLSAFAFLIRLRTDRQLREQEEVVRLLLNEYDANGSEWLFEFDADGRVTFISSRFSDLTGTPIEEVIGRRWIDSLDNPEEARPLSEFVSRGQPYRDFLLSVEVRGERRWWSLSGTPKFGRSGELLGYRGVGSDVTEQQRASERIAELATFDALTGLVNRRIVHQALAEGLQAGKVALLFVDLDRFKAVNDSLGHAAGDRLLKEVALRLRDVVAEMGGALALAGRLGGDEFAVVLRDTGPEDAARLGEALISRLSCPYVLGEKRAVIGASVGLSVGPNDGDTVEALMRAADLALYDVKGKGRGRVRHYDRAMHRQVEDRRELEFDLKSALEQNQLRLVFQPVVNALDERIVAFEALLRWRHPIRGDIPPGIFIPIAEESGLIGRIGDWVLHEACRVAAGWPSNVKIAVNLSPLQFDDPRLVDTVGQALARWNVAPERLELELTESLFLDERPQTAAMLERLRAMGVSFALDDFGTGYSSLGYLQKISFGRIKIDRSFVQASAADGGESTAIIQAIVALAERLGMETTAEGTETRAEFEAMRRLGCGQMQGWYFGRPMDPENVRRLLDRTRPLVELVEGPVRDAAIWPIRAGRSTSPATSVQSPAEAVRSSPPSRREPHAPLRG
jgi:diguanylate cyclase (GGDEF)-like protein/PAS domain S-box-containing protein